MTTAQGSLQGHVGMRGGGGLSDLCWHRSSLGHSHAAVQGVAWQGPQHSPGWPRSEPELGVLAYLLIPHSLIGKMSCKHGQAGPGQSVLRDSQLAGESYTRKKKQTNKKTVIELSAT